MANYTFCPSNISQLHIVHGRRRQTTHFEAKVHQIRLRLGLRPRPRGRSLQRSPRPPIVGSQEPTFKGKGWEGRGQDIRDKRGGDEREGNVKEGNGRSRGLFLGDGDVKGR